MNRTLLISMLLAAVGLSVLAWLTWNSSPSLFPFQGDSTQHLSGQGRSWVELASPSEANSRHPEAPMRHEAVAALDVFVVDGSLSPVRGVWGALSAEEGELGTASVATDDNGRLHYVAPPDTAMRLTLRGSAWAPQQLAIASLLPGETRQIGPVVLSRSARLELLVVDPSDVPVANAEVQVAAYTSLLRYLFVEIGMEPASDGVLEARTDSNGVVTLTGLSPGSTRVSIWADALQPWSGDVTLPRRSSEPLLVRLTRAEPRPGRVVDEDGVPLPGARVADLRTIRLPTIEEAEQALERRGNPVEWDGSFAWTPPGRKGTLFVAHAPGRVVAITRAGFDDERLELFLPPAHSLRGRVLDATGRPLVKATVTATVTGESLSDERGVVVPTRATTNVNGMFDLSGWPATTVDLRTTSSEGATRISSVQISEGSLPVEIVIRGTHAMIVRVFDPRGRPLKGASVEFKSADESLSASRIDSRTATTARDGRARVFDLEPGRWDVRVTSRGYAPIEARVSWELEWMEEILLRAVAAGRLVLDVVDETKIPVPGCLVLLEPVEFPRAARPRRGKADDGGRAIFEDLAHGGYWIHITDEAGRPAEAPNHFIRVEAKTERYQLVLSTQPVLQVRVVDAGVPAARVLTAIAPTDDSLSLLYALASPEWCRRTDGRGMAVLVAPEPGDYTLLVRSSYNSPGTVLQLPLRPGVQAVTVELDSGRVGGHVVSSTGERIRDARVTLVPTLERADSDKMSVGWPARSGDVQGLGPGTRASATLRLGEAFVRTDAAGKFEFSRVPSGHYRVLVAAPGFASKTVDPVVVDDSSVDMRGIEVAPLCSLRGAVHGLRSRTLFQLCDDEDGTAVERVWVEAGAGYRFEGILAGTYRIMVHDSGLEHLSEPIQVRAKDENVFDLDLSLK